MILRGCLLRNIGSDFVIIGTYEEDIARTTPVGFDDIFNTPLVPDTDGDGISDEWALVRPETIFELKAEVKFLTSKEIMMTPVGNKGNSLLSVMVPEEELRKKQLLDPITNKSKIRVNDRLLRILDPQKRIKINYEDENTIGLFATDVLPPSTGDDFYTIIFEDRARGPRLNV